MATPNYGYEKRQRELAKKQKKEEKLRAKNARKLNPDGSAVEDGDTSDVDSTPESPVGGDSSN